jgi:hypothetical protein
MSKIHVTQCLCPKRHNIAAIVWEEPEFTPEIGIAKLKSMVQHLFETKAVNPWCGICLSRDLGYEDGISKFTTMPEALSAMAASQVQQAISRDIIHRVTAYQRN